MKCLKKISVFAVFALLFFIGIGGNEAKAGEIPGSKAVYVEDSETGKRKFIGEPGFGIEGINAEDRGSQERKASYTDRGNQNRLDVGEKGQKAENTISIRTEEELKAIGNNLDGYYVLEEDIVLSQGEWISIGSQLRQFTGTLDGNGHAISNLRSSSGNGLFYYIGKEGVIQNLTVSGEITTNDEDAALLSDVSEGTVVNCKAKGSVSQEGDAKSRSGFLLAGLVNVNYGYMENCVNEAEIIEIFGRMGWPWNYAYVGGGVSVNCGSMIECENNADIYSNCMYTGGVSGLNTWNGLIEKCVNKGEVTNIYCPQDVISVVVAAGGITGANSSGVIYHCVNEGTIKGESITEHDDNDIGGIVGISSGFSEIMGCENQGSIIGNRDVGGICGDCSIKFGVKWDENDCLIIDEGCQIMSDCVNNGMIIGRVWLGGIVGSARSGNGEISIFRCTNNGEVRGSEGSSCGGIASGVGANGAGTIKLEWLVNTGNIEVTHNKWHGNAWGIFGSLGAGDTNVTVVRNCENKGRVKADSAYGIACGMENFTLNQCANFGEIFGDSCIGVCSGAIDVKNCHNLGSITGNYNASGIGYFDNGLNCYNAGIVTGKENSYGITSMDDTRNVISCYYLEQELSGKQAGKSLDQEAMQQPQSYEGFDFDNIWGMQEQNGMFLPALNCEMILEKVGIQDIRIKTTDVANVRPVEGAYVNFVSSNPLICAVGSDGKLIPQKAGTVKIHGISGDGQVVDFLVTVDAKELSTCQIVISPLSYSYNGRPHTPKVTIKDGKKNLEEGKDYAVEYKDNTEVGTASVILTGKGNYTGTVTKSFTIKKASQELTHKKIYTKIYGNKPFLLNVKLKGNGELAYASSNRKVATVNQNGRVSIRGTGITIITVKAAKTNQYRAASAKVTVKVKPAKIKNLSLSMKKENRLKINWKKDVRVTGYEVVTDAVLHLLILYFFIPFLNFLSVLHCTS